MVKGAQVTKGSNIPTAQDADFVLNTKFLGGLKIDDVVVIPTIVDFVNPTVVTHPHNLPYVPAVMAFQDGFVGIGWQNAVGVNFPSANADATNVYIQAPSSGGNITVIIFAEKVADA